LKNSVKVTYFGCRGEGERSFNTTPAKDHFLPCRFFQSKFPAQKLELLGKTSTIQAYEAEKSRRSRETTRLVLPIGGGGRPSMVAATAAHLTQTEQIDSSFSEIRSDKKAKKDTNLQMLLSKVDTVLLMQIDGLGSVLESGIRWCFGPTSPQHCIIPLSGGVL
jgi:hypothetical protein